MLTHPPLVAPDHGPAVVTDRRGCLPDPVGGSLPHQFPPCWVNAPSLLVAGQGRGGGDEPGVQAAEQERLPPEVLGVEGGTILGGGLH